MGPIRTYSCHTGSAIDLATSERNGVADELAKAGARASKTLSADRDR